MAKWQLITFWLYQILIQRTFKNFPSLLSNLPLAGPVDKGALMLGSARDDGKAKGAKLDNVPLPLPQQALYFRKWSLYFKARLSGKLLIGKLFFIPWFSHCGKVLHLASFWKWEFSTSVGLLKRTVELVFSESRISFPRCLFSSIFGDCKRINI